jgi:hypothetical protein
VHLRQPADDFSHALLGSAAANDRAANAGGSAPTAMQRLWTADASVSPVAYFVLRRTLMPKQENLARSFTFAIPTALLAALGAAFGAYWQQTYAVQLEKERTLLTIRKEAYNNFFTGQVARGTDTAKYESLVQNARFAIGVYSSKQTVEALADYIEYLGVPDCGDPPKKWKLDVEIYQQMRQELYEDEAVTIYQRVWRSLFGDDHSQRIDDKTMLRVIYHCQIRE